MSGFFCILGAPKCGTTTLAHWMSIHPEIAFCSMKEPRYFNSDFEHPFRPKDLRAYESLFVTHEKTRWRGEATTGYLCSDVAVERILQYEPGAKFIVCIRPQQDLFISLHRQRLKEGFENVKDPRQAWELQSSRLAGRKVPAACPDGKLLNYARFCKIGESISELHRKIGHDRLLVIQLDDLARYPERVMLSVCNFLCISDFELAEYGIKNKGVLIRSTFLAQTLKLLGLLRLKLGIRPLGIASLLARFNKSDTGDVVIDDDFIFQLRDYFRSDFDLLKGLLDSDLSHW